MEFYFYFKTKKYVCGRCGESIATQVGYSGGGDYRDGKNMRRAVFNIYICHSCGRPTIFDPDQIPGPLYGKEIKELPDSNVSSLYDETRNCIKVGAYTASVMCSRKLLMNIAVAEGANENLRFVQYVDYLADNCLPPRAHALAKHIKDKGNEANHEIKPKDAETAKDLISFIEMILTMLYEYPARIGV